jgi:hypothetical protein
VEPHAALLEQGGGARTRGGEDLQVLFQPAVQRLRYVLELGGAVDRVEHEQRGGGEPLLLVRPGPRLESPGRRGSRDAAAAVSRDDDPALLRVPLDVEQLRDAPEDIVDVLVRIADRERRAGRALGKDRDHVAAARLKLLLDLGLRDVAHVAGRRLLVLAGLLAVAGAESVEVQEHLGGLPVDDVRDEHDRPVHDALRRRAVLVVVLEPAAQPLDRDPLDLPDLPGLRVPAVRLCVAPAPEPREPPRGRPLGNGASDDAVAGRLLEPEDRRDRRSRRKGSPFVPPFLRLHDLRLGHELARHPLRRVARAVELSGLARILSERLSSAP